jgi:hypothetical protein
LAHKNVERAIADLKSLLEFQQDDGRIPEIINWESQKEGFIWRLLTRIQYSHTTHNDLTQMPVLPYRFAFPSGVVLIVA